MSESTPEAIELPSHGDAAFGALMDALAPEPNEAPAGAAASEAGAGAAAAAGGAAAADAPAAGQPGGAPAGAGTGAGAAAAAGGDAAAGGGDGAAGQPGGEQAPGADGAAAGGAEQPAATPGAGDRPAAWTAPAAELIPKLGQLSTALEENTAKAYQSAAFEAVREEHGQYFEALEKHPRLLVGTQVPAIGKDGMETLRDTADAKEWQDAVKQLLVAEVRDRAGRDMEESADFLASVHASIELFQNNADLVPGTKDFDVELANQFAEMAAPYELRHEGKLQGYSIPVQPLIDRLRTQLTAQRAQAKTPPATPAPVAPATPAAPAATPDPPQAGIRGKAGNSSDKEDFSSLFGTIGLPNLQI